MKSVFSILTSFLLCVSAVGAEPIEVSVNPDKTLNPIDERVYGHFLEHIYNSCNGGLWGDLVWNRSFEAGSAQKWNFEDGVFRQDSREKTGFVTFGDENWTDYELTLDAKKFSGKEGFLILFRAAQDDFYWVNLGGWQNSRNALERSINKERKIVDGDWAKFTPIETGRTYQIRVRVEGSHYQIFVDGKLLFDVKDELGPQKGAVGIGSWDTVSEYQNVKVCDLNGQLLCDFSKTSPDAQRMRADVRFWDVEGPCAVRSGDARNSEKYLSFSGGGTLSQKNYAFVTGETYDYSYWIRGTGKVSFQASGSSVFPALAKTDEWQKVSGSFQVSENTKDGSIQFTFAPTGGKTLDIDQVSIMPRSWKENYFGMRPDLLNAVKDIRPAVIRWPGGCYASAYRWKDGIGPQDDRGSYPVELWNDKDVNSFGIDEFMNLCRYVGAEPIMVVDVGTQQWSWTLKEGESIDLQEAVDWVEYCNGAADTKWGAVRAKNGHPEPYNVKYWEIDNEVHPEHTPVDEYVNICNTLIPRMKAVDPSITVVACGSWAGRDRFGWDENVGVRVKGISFVSTHQYDNPDGYAVNPYRNQRFFEERRQILEKSGNPNLRFFDSEWNAQSTDWRTGLHAGGILNCFEKVGDVVAMATPALFLRHTSANGWDNAFINFDHTGWFPAPNYVVMKLWRGHYAANRVELQSESNVMQGEEPLVNAVATRSEDGKTVCVKVVNNQLEDAPMNIQLNGCKILKAAAQCVTPELEAGEEVTAKLKKRNTLEDPNAISAKPLAASVDGSTVSVTLPSLSATVVEVIVE